MKSVFIIMWDGKPLFAFDTLDEADDYIIQACKNAMEDGWNMKRYSRENFYATQVYYFVNA